MVFRPEAHVEKPEELKKTGERRGEKELAHYDKTSFKGEKLEPHATPQRCEEKKASVSVCVCLWLKMNLKYFPGLDKFYRACENETQSKWKQDHNTFATGIMLFICRRLQMKKYKGVCVRLCVSVARN